MKELPNILIQEEKEMFAPCQNDPDVLATIHNDAVRTRAIAHITDIITKPLLSTLIQRLELNEIRKIQLQSQLDSLKTELKTELNDMSEQERANFFDTAGVELD